MIARVVAWTVLLVAGALAYQYGGSWSSPWSVLPGSPVLSQLPAASNGCGKDCK